MNTLHKRVSANFLLILLAVLPFVMPSIHLSDGQKQAAFVLLFIAGVLSARRVLGWSWIMSFVMFIPGLLTLAVIPFMWSVVNCGWIVTTPKGLDES
jgi:hypothetical protein